MDNNFIAELRRRNPAVMPINSKEDIVDRIVDGFVPSRRVFQVYISPEGEFLSESETIHRLVESVNAVYDEMTPEELNTFKAVIAHVYRKRCVQQRTKVLAVGGLVLVHLIAWQVIKNLWQR